MFPQVFFQKCIFRYYILVQKFYLNDTQENDFEIVGVYAKFTEAKEELEKIKKDNIENYGFVQDNDNKWIIFQEYQENWNNYIEYNIIDKTIKL